MSNTYQLYLRDFGYEVKDMALEAKQKCIKAKNTDSESFYEGYLSGFQAIISLMQQMAVGFDISFVEIGVDNIDPYKDLI